MSALVTFKCFLGVGGQSHSQAEADSGGAASDQHHLCIHGFSLIEWGGKKLKKRAQVPPCVFTFDYKASHL